MMLRILRNLREREQDERGERGIALIAVVAIGAVLMILVASMLAVSTSGSRKAAGDVDYNAAGAAAYAGLADYQSKLSADNGYSVYGRYGTTFSASSSFNQTGPSTTNNAFSNSASGNVWVPVQGSDGRESYRYEVDNSNYYSSGVLKVRVTGRSGTVTRSIVANLKGTGFINYVYFTDYESQNPAVSGETASNSTALCTNLHRTEITTANSASACAAVAFATGDVLQGPVRTNDVITACGATFNGEVDDTGAEGQFYTSKSATTTNSDANCVSSTTFTGSKYSGPHQVATLSLPQTNNSMIQEARTDLPTTVPRPGCLYTGPTSVTFNGNGTMTVVSPWTLATWVTGTSDGTITGGTGTGAAATQCGSLSALHSAGGATIPTLASNLIYIQNVPSSTTDPNYWGSTSYPTTLTSTPGTGTVFCNQSVGTGTNKKTYYGNGLGYPLANEFNTNAANDYACRAGDAFVSGAFGDGSATTVHAMTVGAQNNLYIVGDITYKNTSKDILGLVGQKTVSVWNPISCSKTTTNSSGATVCDTGVGSSTDLKFNANDNRTISAAIASNAGTFQLQNYAYGADLGTLTVKGSIAQKFRGAVAVQYSVCTQSYYGYCLSYGTRVSGFAKNYQYDSRLLTTAPPKYLQPVSTSYGITSEVDVPAAYNADGSPRS